MTGDRDTEKPHPPEDNGGKVPSDVAAARLARMDAYLSTLPVPSEDERKAVWDALDELYDDDGLPK
jgi:hypothetical protein